MKLFALWIFSFLFINKLQSQNCKSLDKEPFFTSIKFGAPIPENLVDCGKKKKVDLSTFSQVQIAYDSLSKECKKKYADLFTYHKVRFLTTQIETNKKGKIMEVSRYSFLDKVVDGSAINYNPPAEFTALYNKLHALYGKPTNIETPTRIDSLLISQKGMTQMVGWYCNDIFLELRVSYGAPEKLLNLISVKIRNMAFDLPEVDMMED